MLLRMKLTSVVVVASLLLVQLTAAAAGSKQVAPPELKGLCSDAYEELPIRGLDLLLEDLADLEGGQQEHNCPDYVIRAMRELRDIVDDELACSMNKAEAIVNFAKAYLREPVEGMDSTGTKRDSVKRLPRALARLAVSYGMQIHDVCQEEAATSFLYNTARALPDSLGEQLSVYVLGYMEKSPLNYVLTPIMKHNEVVLPEDLYKVLPGLEKEVENLVANSKDMATTRSLCANQLGPLYEPMLLPLALLQRNGFLKGHAKARLEYKRLAKFWTLTTFLCEALKMAPTRGALDTKKAQLLDDLTSNLIAETRNGLDEEATGGNLDNADDELKQGEIRFETPLKKIQPIKRYQTKSKFTRNDLVRADQASLRVHSYDANRDEVEILRDRIASRSFRVFKMMSRKGMHSGFVKKVLKVLLKKEDSSADLDKASQGLVELMQAKEEDSVLFRVAKLQKYMILSPFILIGFIFGAVLKAVGCFIGAIIDESQGAGGGANGPSGSFIAFSYGSG